MSFILGGMLGSALTVFLMGIMYMAHEDDERENRRNLKDLDEELKPK